MITLREFLRLGWIVQRIKISKGTDWRSCQKHEAEGFMPKEWLNSNVLSFSSDWDVFEIEIEEA